MQKSVMIGAPRGVDLAHVERELATLWDAAAKLPEPGPGVTRACSMNLVAVTDDRERARDEGEVLGDVSVAHPARILHLVQAADRSSSDVSVTVSARCTIPVPGRGQVCSEEIVVEAARRESFFSIVSSLLVADVPTIVLWRSPLDLQDPLLVPLATVADRVLIDSTAAPQPQVMLRSWYELMHAPGGAGGSLQGLTLAGDLSWTRLGPMREMLAASVQSPAMRALLSAGRELLIEYGDGAMAQAILFAAWFASRVGWSAEGAELSKSGGTVYCTGGTGPSECSLRIIPSSGVQDVVRVALTATESLRAEVRRTETPGCAHVTRVHDGLTTEEHIRHAVTGTEAELIVRELEILEHDQPYESAMRWAGELLRRPGQ